MTAEELKRWLKGRVAELAGLPESEIDSREPLAGYGLSSRDAVQLSGELEEVTGRVLSPTLVYEHPSIEALSRHVSELESEDTPGEPGATEEAAGAVAIVGLACRLPAAPTPRAFWRLLCDGIDAIGPVPRERWSADEYYHPDPSVPGKAVTRWGGFLDGVDGFDAFFFGISPGEAERMDPQQRLLLELAYEAFEDAGCVATLAGSRCGVFVGVSVNEYGFGHDAAPELIDAYSGTGSALSIAANRISYHFDLHGPSVALDTACSSSLYAIHEACASLRSGGCSLAVAGGVNLILSPAHSIAFTKAGVLSPTGRCRSFDASADGTVRGEGGGLVVLKPLDRALADGDRIHAVVRGGAVGQDGRTNGLMAPNGGAQVDVLTRAYRSAGVDPSLVQYVEAHGTATVVGDAIELEALGAVVGRGREGGPCRIGSVKSNLGHLEAAAGVAGLIKVVLALRHRMIPPSIHFEEPNPHVDIQGIGLGVQRELTDWPEMGGSRLAGVSSFGFGGTNVHLVLEEGPTRVSASEVDAHLESANPECERARPGTEAVEPAAELLFLSAATPASLDALTEAYGQAAGSAWEIEGVALRNVCAAAATRRAHLDHRVAIVSDCHAGIAERVQAYLQGEPHADVLTGRVTGQGCPPVVFAFSGQGGQWPGMGRELLRSQPAFRRAVERCEEAMAPHLDWSLTAALEGSSDRTGDIDVIQPTLFAMQVGLAELWRSWDVEPSLIIGHSLGEIAGAYVAGVLDLETAARLVCARSSLLTRLIGRGTMAVVGLSADETRSALSGRADGVSIAALQSPVSTAVTGDRAALEELVRSLEASGLSATLIDVDVAGHSRHMDELLDELRESITGLRPSSAAIPIVSTVTGKPCDGASMTVGHWLRNLRDAVAFAPAMEHVLAGGPKILLEIGPHPILRAPLQQCVVHAGSESAVVASQRKDEPVRASLLRALGALHVLGHPAAAARAYARPEAVPDLPTYRWERARYWLELPRRPAGGRRRAPTWDGHPLLVTEVGLAHDPSARVWEADADRAPAIAVEHEVDSTPLLPAAAYIETALTASARAGLAKTHDLVDVRFVRPMACAPTSGPCVQVALTDDGDVGTKFSVHSRKGDAGTWSLNATARLRPIAGPPEHTRGVRRDIAALRRTCPMEIETAALYARLEGAGVVYGPSFRGLERLWSGADEALGRIVLPAAAAPERGRYRIHPALLDACLHVLYGQSVADQGNGPESGHFLPVSVDRVRLLGEAPERLWSHARIVERRGAEVGADVTILDDEGRLVAELVGLHLVRVEVGAAGLDGAERDSWLYRLEWRSAPHRPAATTDPSTKDLAERWLVLTDEGGVGEELVRRLDALGEASACVPVGDVLDASNPDEAVRARIESALDTVGGPLRGVVHLWGIDATSVSVVDGTGDLAAARALGPNAAAALVSALMSRSSVVGAPRLWLVTEGGQSVGPGESVAPWQASLWGLGKSIAFELPELECTLVDLEPAGGPSARVSQLLDELMASDREREVALRGGARFAPRLLPYDATEVRYGAASTPGFGEDATYLVVGGLGGIGLTVVRGMAQRGARHLVVMGRSDPSPATEAVLAQLRSDGIEVVAVACDVSVRADVAATLEKIRAQMPPLRGVVHSAVVLDDGAVVRLDPKRMARVMRPKVEGAWILHGLTAPDPLDFFVLFSSAVSVLGSPGQGNYSAANAFLDALAHHRRARGQPAISINWGPWSQVGLAASRGFFDGDGVGGDEAIKGIRPEQGLELLWGLLDDPEPQVTVLPFDLRSLIELYPTAADMPLFEEVGGCRTHVARRYSRPSLREEYVAPRTEIERQLAELWQRTLRVDRIGVRDSFFGLGGDSVLAARLMASAHRSFGVQLDLKETFERFTIEEVARRIEVSLEVRVRPTIGRRPAVADVPLSFVQERQLFLEVLAPGTAVNNLPLCLELEGPLDADALARALSVVVGRHDALRTGFDIDQGRARPRVRSDVDIQLELVDLTRRFEDPDAEGVRRVEHEARAPVDPGGFPLFRVRLYRIAPDRHLLSVVLHHTIADGWSIGVVVRELAAVYAAEVEGRPHGLPELPVEYGDYAWWQRERSSSPEGEESARYWLTELGGDLPVLELPLDHPRPARQSYAGAVHRFAIPSELVDRVRRVARGEEATLFMALLSGYQAVLQRYTGQDEIIVGTPHANRGYAEIADSIGAFINTVVLRGDLSGDPTFRELVRRTRLVAIDAYAHQEMPFEELVRRLNPRRDLSRMPIFQTVFNLQSTTMPALSGGGLTISPKVLDRGACEVDLELMLTERDSGLEAALSYNPDLFTEATVARIARSYLTLLDSATSSPDLPLSTLPVVSELDHRLLEDLNDTAVEYPADALVSELVGATASASLDSVAVRYQDEELTYGELLEWSHVISTELAANGVGIGDRVGVMIGPSPALVAAFLAVLDAGGAYLPISLDAPGDRVRFMLRDAGVRMVLVGAGGRIDDLDEEPGGSVKEIVVARPVESGGPGALIGPTPGAKGVDRPRPGPRDVAYVMYTSGTTGAPKGVLVPHGALANLLFAMRDELALEGPVRLLSVTPPTFDIAGLELFLPLLLGGTVVIAGEEARRNRERLQALIRDREINVMQATPATWRMLLEGDWEGEPALVALCGGDTLTGEVAAELLGRVGRLWNLYGPTETTIWSSAGAVEVEDAPITIGRPIANTKFFVVDRFSKSAPIGVAGELCIAGAGLAVGYLNRPDLTAARFVDLEVGGGRERVFRTGDRARVLAGGSIELLGRWDRQVKVHGYRIELGEVEAAMRRHWAVADAVVVVGRGLGGEAGHLVAHYVPRVDPAGAEQDLREFLQTVLPSYMIPARLVARTDFPLTSHGKIDRGAVAAECLDLPAESADTPFVAPRSAEEEWLAAAYARVLHRDRVGVDDNFFDLGGGSIQILEIVVEGEARGYSLTPALFFEHQTVSELASAIEAEAT